MLRYPLVFICVFTLMIGVCAAEEAEQPVATEDAPSLAAIIAFLKPADVVLRVGDMQSTWGELQPQVIPMLKPQGAEVGGDGDELSQKLQAMLQRIALRGLYLLETRAQGVTVSAEEKERSERELEASLSGNPDGITRDSFIEQFASGSSTLLKLNYDDALKIVKLGNEMLAKITVSEQEVTRGMAMAAGLREPLKQQNAMRRQAILELMKDASIHTDEGFAKLAREYSEGVEARRGGELNFNFRRKELAEVNAVERFDLQPGQTSGLYETDTAFRIMRVLKSIPAEKPEDGERLRMAQILFKKIPVSAEIDREDIKAKILLEKQNAARDLFGRKLQEKYPIECVLFPKGLW